MARDTIDSVLTVDTEEVASYQEVIVRESASEEPTVPIMFLEGQAYRGLAFFGR